MAGFTLGADPEIVFRQRDGLLSAQEFLPRQDGHDGDNPEFGADGHPHIAELRTKPCDTPRELIEDIRGILQRNHHMIPDHAAWIGGSFIENKPIGGHIHFGGIQPSGELVAALDGFVTQLVLLIEERAEAKRRRGGQYGQLGDIRTKPWGFEYRPLPSWMVSPNIALGIVGLATAVVHEQLDNGSAALTKLRRKQLELVSRIDKRRFRNADKEHFLNKLEDLYGIIRKFSYWRTEEGRELWKNVALLRHIAINYPDWHNDKDILARWKVRDATPPSYKIVRTNIVPIVQENAVLNQDDGWVILQNAVR